MEVLRLQIRLGIIICKISSYELLNLLNIRIRRSFTIQVVASMTSSSAINTICYNYSLCTFFTMLFFFFGTKTLISHPSFSLKYRLASLQYFLCELCYAHVISHRHLSCDPVKRQRTTQASPTNLFPLISFFLDLCTLRRNTDCLTQIPKAIQFHTKPT